MWKNDPAVALPRGLHEGVGTHAVRGAKVDALGVVPILTVCIDLLDSLSGDRSSGDGVQIQPLFKYTGHDLISRDPAGRAQLHRSEIAANEHVAWRRSKELAVPEIPRSMMNRWAAGRGAAALGARRVVG